MAMRFVDKYGKLKSASEVIGWQGQKPDLTSLMELAKQWQTKQEEAEAENIRRYEEGLGIIRATGETTRGLIEGMGAAEAKDITESGRLAAAKAHQDIVARGLAGTSAPYAAEEQIRRGTLAELGRLDERLRRERINLELGLTGMETGWIERREDVYPQMEQLFRVAAAMGEGGLSTEIMSALMAALSEEDSALPPREWLARGETAGRPGW